MRRRFVVSLYVGLFLISLLLQPSDSETTKKDINRATVEELMAIKGIGRKRAESIVKYIRKKGGISRMDELLQLRGIGEKTLNRLKRFYEVKRGDNRQH
jgi:competence protein ComEA